MRKLILLLGIAVLFFIGIFMWWNNSLTPVNPNDSSEKIFLIQPGSGVSTIADNLKSEGLIKNPLVFRIYVTQSGIDKKIQAGDFRLSPSMSSQDIAKELTIGAIDVWVTVPEGKRAEEIAAILEDKIPTNYLHYFVLWHTVLLHLFEEPY